jgi:hypothetical protein
VIFESTQPLKSRNQFRFRTIRHIGLIGVAFVLTVILLSRLILPGNVIPMVIGDTLALAGAGILFALWEQRLVYVRCKNCGKTISSSTAWVCGMCGRPNRNPLQFPFVHRCEFEDCGAEPKAYRCHLCNELIFLTRDKDKNNFAYAFVSQTDGTAPDKRSDKKRSQQEALEDKDHQIQMAEREVIKARLDARLVEVKHNAQSKPRTAVEAYREQVRDYTDDRMAVEEAVRQQKALNSEECKGNPSMLRRKNLVADQWASEQLDKT